MDRKVVLINSCNIQDRPNLEMMTHLEGPVVDSFYDVALHCWYNKLEPPLPNISKPYAPPRDANGNVRYLFRDYNPYFRDIEVLKAARAARKLLRHQTQQIDDENLELAGHPTRDRLVEAVRQAMAGSRQSFAHNKEELASRLAHNKEEIAHRSASAMKEVRAFGERMGMSFDRFGSRPGSRRASATDLTMLRRDEGDLDEETAAHTAANRLLTKPAPSDAPTSPTLNEFPMKSGIKAQHDDPVVHDEDQTTTVNSSRRQSFHSAHDELSHDGHGPPMTTDYPEPILRGPIVESPEHSVRNRAEILASDTNGLSTKVDGSPAIPHTSPFDDHPSSSHGHHVAVAAPRRSFQWADDLPSGAQSPLYMPRISVDEEIPPGRGTKRMFKLAKRFSKFSTNRMLTSDAGALSEAWATVEDSDELDTFRAHVIHAPHDPFPVAMVCRRPHGVPGHHDIANPQNAAWLAGCRYAKRKVFIQTPTFNARPLVRAVKQACRRGVEVILFVDLGFNDMAESIMFQVGNKSSSLLTTSGWHQRAGRGPLVQKAGQGGQVAVSQGLLVHE